jgi:hypothetical protein
MFMYTFFTRLTMNIYALIKKVIGNCEKELIEQGVNVKVK